MDIENSNQIDQHIAARLVDLTPLVDAESIALFGRAMLPGTYAARFLEIYSDFIAGWETGQLFENGWHSGIASAQFLNRGNTPFYSIIHQLEQLRNELFFVFLPEQLEPECKRRYYAGLANFITGYVRGVAIESSIREYREIGEVARRLTLAESPDHLEREAVGGVFRILEVEYAWFTHRENGFWNISHATELSALAKQARVRDEDVDEIDLLLQGKALIYENLAICAPAMRSLGKLLRLGSALSVPVMSKGVCTGTVGIGRRKPSTFTEHDLAIVRLVASQTAAAMSEKHAAVEMRDAIVALQDSEEKLRVLAESIPQIVWTANPDGWIDWYNKRWYEYTGQTLDEAKGWGWQAVHHPEDLPDVMQRWPHSIASGEPFEMEFRLKGSDGLFRWFLTRITPVRNEAGHIIKWYGSNTDIDLQKQTLRRKEEIANTLQQLFIPKAFPVTEAVSFDAVYIPADDDAQVGGDWYDAFELPDGRLVFSIGDVAGHGLEAAVTMGKIRQNIFSASLDSSLPSEVLAKVNRVLLLQEATMATALVGFIDPLTQRVTYAAAGHAPPVAASAEGVRFLPCSGLPLGIQEALESVDHAFFATPGSLLVLYTDGVTESDKRILEGEKRLLEAVDRVRTTGDFDVPAQTIRDLTIDKRHQQDDLAILVIRFLDPHIAGGVSSIQTRPYGMAWDFSSADSEAAQRARRQIVEFVRRFSSGVADLFAVETIVGELIANTVDHAPGPVHIDIDWTETAPTLSVHDRGAPFVPRQSDLPDIMSEDGRGLFLIHALGSNVTVRRHSERGKDVSVVLPVRRVTER
ncbi:MAG: SpoIIE family protein phosphatase [Candidatus Eremiobacteraeota bacterium]|nr:SpoIIE family protein phosphatase [Candidatus Eremiobacteraeota bacterium]